MKIDSIYVLIHIRSEYHLSLSMKISFWFLDTKTWNMLVLETEFSLRVIAIVESFCW